MATEQEKSQQEAVQESEQPVEPEATEPEVLTEAAEVEVKSVQEQLAEQVKSCMSGGGSCEGLGSKFDEAAEELGIEVNELIDQVFEILSPKEG